MRLMHVGFDAHAHAVGEATARPSAEVTAW
jgi:hypothetical protein